MPKCLHLMFHHNRTFALLNSPSHWNNLALEPSLCYTIELFTAFWYAKGANTDLQYFVQIAPNFVAKLAPMLHRTFNLAMHLCWVSTYLRNVWEQLQMTSHLNFCAKQKKQTQTSIPGTARWIILVLRFHNSHPGPHPHLTMLSHTWVVTHNGTARPFWRKGR